MLSLKPALMPKQKSSARRSRGFLLFLFLPLLFSCAGEQYQLQLVSNEPKETLAEAPLSLWVASDLHYLDPHLTDHGAFFQQTVNYADSKLTTYCSEILEAFLAKVKEEKPDALCLTGDLTFNGEKLSHEALSSFLNEVTSLGTAVLVIPGNHDIASPYAYSYRGDGYSKVANVSPNEFLKIYAETTYQKAISVDEKSLSYIYPLRKDAWVLALSADGDPSETGLIPSSTLDWVEQELAKAKAQGIQVYSLTHESLLSQNANFLSSMLHNAAEVANVEKRYGVIANSSGHLHIQHFAIEDGLPDIVTSSLVVAPFHYGRIQWTSDSFTYRSQNLDVSSYAKRMGWSDPNLLNLTSYGEDFFYHSNEVRIRARLIDSDYSDGDIEKLVASYLPLNYHYYQGVVTDESVHAEGYALWKASTWSFARYIQSMMASDQSDFNSYRKTF